MKRFLFFLWLMLCAFSTEAATPVSVIFTTTDGTSTFTGTTKIGVYLPLAANTLPELTATGATTLTLGVGVPAALQQAANSLTGLVTGSSSANIIAQSFTASSTSGTTVITGTNVATPSLSGTDGVTAINFGPSGTGTSPGLAVGGLTGEVILQHANGSQVVYTGSINAAYAVSGTTDSVIVGSGTYNEQIALSTTKAHSFRFDPGAVLNYSGSGAAIFDSGSNVGLVNIAGKGTLENTGTFANESVMSISGSGTQLGVTCYQVLETGTSVTTGSNECAIKSDNGGYAQVQAKDFIGTNCGILEESGRGSYFLKAEDQIASSGSGVSTIYIGNGYTGSSSIRETPGWITCKRLLSDPNSYVDNVVGTPVVHVQYINADRIGGCFRDPSTDMGVLVLYVKSIFWDPQYNSDGSSTATTMRLAALDAINSSYNFDVQDMQGHTTTPLVELDGGSAGGGAVLNFGRLRNEGSGTALTVNGGSGNVSALRCQTTTNTVAIEVDAGTLSFTGNCPNQLAVTGGSVELVEASIGSLNQTGGGFQAYNSSISNAVCYPTGAQLADSMGNLYYSENNDILADASGNLYYINGNVLADYLGNLCDNQSNVLDNGADIFYPGGNSYPLADDTDLVFPSNEGPFVSGTNIYAPNGSGSTPGTPIINGTGGWVGPSVNTGPLTASGSITFSSLTNNGIMTTTTGGIVQASVPGTGVFTALANAVNTTGGFVTYPAGGVQANIIRVNGTLVSGTATIGNAAISGSNVWVQDNASSLTNVGSLTVTTSSTNATVKSTNVSDTSPFSLFIKP